MKKLILTLSSFLILVSCSKDDGEKDDFIGTIVDKEFTIKNSGVVSYYLGDLGEEGIAQITTEPEHASLSRLVESQYTYEPEDGYVGDDYVELFSSIRSTLPNGNNTSKNTRTRITIRVTD